MSIRDGRTWAGGRARRHGSRSVQHTNEYWHLEDRSRKSEIRGWGYTANYDGKDNPITGNCLYGDVVAATRVDHNSIRLIYKKGGTVTVTQTFVVSSDGKTGTVTGTGTNAAGQTVSSVVVYDKQ